MRISDWSSDVCSSDLACVADGGPEALVAHGVGGAQANVAEAGDAGVAAAVPATAGQRRAPRQLDPIAGRITESDEATHLALGSFVRGADVHRVAERLEFRGGGIEFGGGVDFERNRLVGGIALEVAQGVLPLVGAEIRRAAALLAELQAPDIRGIARRAGNVTRAQAYVADVAQIGRAHV